MAFWTRDDLHHALDAATSRGDVCATVWRAVRIVGVQTHDALDQLERVRLGFALLGECGVIQQIAEDIASEVLCDESRNAA